MPLYSHDIHAIPSATDHALVRWDGSDGDVVQDSNETLSDTGVLTLPDTTSQVIVGGATPTFVVAGATLTPRMITHTSAATEPNVAFMRDSGSAAGGPTHNFFRKLSGGVVGNGTSLLIIGALGFDDTDYAQGAQIDVVVDEADSGTASVGANQMGSKWRFLTSRRGTQSPGLSMQIRHNGALQLNPAITLMATPSAGCLEAQADVLHYTPEDFSRAVVVSKYFTRINSAFTLNATTTEQSMFPAGQSTLTLTTGVYHYEVVAALSGMSSTSGNAAFDLVGTGSALLAQPLNLLDGMDGAINTANANTGSFNNAAQTPASMIVAGISTEMGFRIHGSFTVTASGTIQPSLTLVTASAAVVAAGSYFTCYPVAALNATCTGPWS